MIQPMAEMMSGDDPMLKSEAKQVLFDIVARVSDPEGSARERKEVKRAIKKSMKITSAEITSDYLEWIIGMIK